MQTPVLFSVIALALSTLSAHALSLEGRLTTGRGGSFDVRIEVAEKSSGTLQVLLIPQVRVEDGRFAIPLTTDLAPYDLADLSFAVTARPTESYAPFQPVADSRVTGKAP